ncbi:MAG: hypothetical protein IKK36_12885 [Bacteroidales bacterium]|nr:hypothetical protein [Bacteroidales bacterium]
MNFIEFLHSIDYFDLFSNALLYCHCGSQTDTRYRMESVVKTALRNLLLLIVSIWDSA